MTDNAAKRRLVVVRHVAFEHLGALAPPLAARGWHIDYRDAGVDPLTLGDADAVVILGGPISANDDADYPFLRDEFALVATAMERDLPLLGICLGAQVIARVLGCLVAQMPEPEIGFAPIAVTEAGVRTPFAPFAQAPAFHWHGEQVRPGAGMRVLATSQEGAVTQVFAVGTRVLGVQCHLEFPLVDLPLWLVGHSHELASHGIRPATLRDQAVAAAGTYEPASLAFAEAYAAAVTGGTALA